MKVMRLDRDGDDAAARALDPGDAAGLVHAREHPAAENIAVGVGVGGMALMRTVSSPRGFASLIKDALRARMR
jgi:hypothetical protein